MVVDDLYSRCVKTLETKEINEKDAYELVLGYYKLEIYWH